MYATLWKPLILGCFMGFVPYFIVCTSLFIDIHKIFLGKAKKVLLFFLVIVTASCSQGSALRNRQSVCDTLETAHFGVFYGVCAIFYGLYKVIYRHPQKYFWVKPKKVLLHCASCEIAFRGTSFFCYKYHDIYLHRYHG